MVTIFSINIQITAHLLNCFHNISHINQFYFSCLWHQLKLCNNSVFFQISLIPSFIYVSKTFYYILSSVESLTMDHGPCDKYDFSKADWMDKSQPLKPWSIECCLIHSKVIDKMYCRDLIFELDAVWNFAA